MTLMAAGKLREAVIEFRNAIQQDPRFGRARFQLAEAYAATGNPSGALQEYVRAADLLPTDNVAQTRAAMFLLVARRFEDAKTRIQKVLESDPNNVEALILHGNALAALKDLVGATKEIEEALELNPDSPQGYATLAAIRLAEGDREKANAAFEKAVSVDPSSMNARLALANFQWSTGDSAGAEASLKRALELDPQHSVANQALATLYMGSGRAAEAEPYLKAAAAPTGAPSAQLRLADYYIAMNRTSDARSILESLVRERGKGVAAEAESRLAALVYAGGDKAGAVRTVEGVLARSPGHVPSLLLKARWLAVEGRVAEAVVPVQAAVQADPDSVRAHFLLGMLHTSQRQTRDAIADFNEVLRLNPRAGAAQLYLSHLHLASGASDIAVQFAESALKRAPGNPDARSSLIRGLIARRDFARAEAELGSLKKQFPEVGLVHALEGTLRLQQGNATGARRSYEQALALSPDLFEAISGMTTIDLRQNLVVEARSRLNARLAANPDRADLLLLSAQVSAVQREIGHAEAELRRAIQVDPGNAQAYGMLASVLLAQNKLDAALAEFDQMTQRDPHNVGAQTMAAMIVERQSKADAQKRYEQIVATLPRAAVAANNLAWIYADAGTNLDEALRLAQSAALDLPDNPDVHDTIGWVYYKQQRPVLAIRAFERSIEKAPANPLYHHHLALAYAKAGETARALQSAQQALKLKPDYADAQKLVASMK
jgi:tetratricopeptide (TPR) repeat protein